MGLVTRLKTWVTGEVLDSADLNGEFNVLQNVVNGNLEAANIADDAIEAQHINGGIGTGIISLDSIPDQDRKAIDPANNVIIPANKLLIGEPFAFSAHKNTTDQTVSTGSAAILTWSTENFDTQTDFASNTFTPQAKGKYYSRVQVNITDVAGSGEKYILYIYKNGAAAAKKTIYSAAAGYLGIDISIVVDMDGNTDNLKAYIEHAAGSDRDVSGAVIESFFEGYLIALSSST